MAVDIKGSLSKQIGPLKAWQWGAAIGGGLLVYRIMRGGGGGGSSATPFAFGTSEEFGGGGSGTNPEFVLPDLPEVFTPAPTPSPPIVIGDGGNVRNLPPVSRIIDPNKIGIGAPGVATFLGTSYIPGSPGFTQESFDAFSSGIKPISAPSAPTPVRTAAGQLTGLVSRTSDVRSIRKPGFLAPSPAPKATVGVTSLSPTSVMAASAKGATTTVKAAAKPLNAARTNAEKYRGVVKLAGRRATARKPRTVPTTQPPTPLARAGNAAF